MRGILTDMKKADKINTYEVKWVDSQKTRVFADSNKTAQEIAEQDKKVIEPKELDSND